MRAFTSKTSLSAGGRVCVFTIIFGSRRSEGTRTATPFASDIRDPATFPMSNDRRRSTSSPSRPVFALPSFSYSLPSDVPLGDRRSIISLPHSSTPSPVPSSLFMQIRAGS